MANEIAVSATLTVSKGGASVSSTTTGTFTMTGDEMLTNVQNVGTSAEAITIADLDTAGYAFFKNMDATNFVELALDSGVSTQIFAKLYPGQVALIPLKTTTIYAKADTAGINLLVTACEL